MDYQRLQEDIFKYSRFLFGGGISLILNILITYILTDSFDLWHMLSFAIALTIEILFLFMYHSLFTFRKRGKFLLFVMVILGISALNWSFVYLLSVILQLQYLISIVISAGVISLLNYTLNKKIVFCA
ncbi:MAG: GtrA family protein [Nanoarchaeota archaeon]|nr:GtrA family protein [Nanoarchaeota archaeon]